jgi:hypothetical protein|tara:strand:- start:1460 stop:1990 length:531 start_codon:yes stop_codon:yes gene_type:complete
MSKIPPYIVNHPEDGSFRIGKEEEGKAVRRSQIACAAGSAASLRIFEDGGWELRATENDKGSNLIQKGAGPINIKSEGDINIDCKGTFNVMAKDIIMKATDPSTGDIYLHAEHDVHFEGKNFTKLIGHNVTINAADKLLSNSKGFNIIIGDMVRIHEPQSKLIPPALGDYINSLVE